MSNPATYVCRVDTTEGTRDYVTLWPPDIAFSKGLIAEAIVGILHQELGADETIKPELFSRNSVFHRFLHEVIARCGPEIPDLNAEAARVGFGFVAIVDQRTPTPDDQVPPEDIIGAFEVRDGTIVPELYRPSPNHRLLTIDGFFQLDPLLARCLLRELAARSG